MIRSALSLELLRKFRTETKATVSTRRYADELDKLRQVGRRSQAVARHSAFDESILRRKLQQVPQQ
ncbi:MAG: hypothetical protein KDE09_24520 [Anaerolineales bacterium]|nr:hypothetical protein [Anaerolineales bacterium]